MYCSKVAYFSQCLSWHRAHRCAICNVLAKSRRDARYDDATSGGARLDPAAHRAAMTASIAAFLQESPNGVVRLRIQPGQLTAFHKCWDTNGWLGDGRVRCRAALFLVTLITPDAVIKACPSETPERCYSLAEQDARAWIKREIAGNDQTTAEKEGEALLRRVTRVVPLTAGPKSAAATAVRTGRQL